MKILSHEERFNLEREISSLLSHGGCGTRRSNLANAQVIYTDIPDTTLLTGDIYSLDLNNDGIADYVIGVTPNLNSTFNSVEIYVSSATNTNAVAASLGPASFYYPFLIESGALINQADTWFPAYPFATLLFIYTTGSIQGNWQGGIANGFMGLRFKISGQTHYGWVRLDLAADAKSAVVKDYAYNTTPDSGIVATADLQGVQELTGSFATITANENQLQIVLPISINNTRLEITNIQGQQVLNKGLKGSAESIDLSSFLEGTYVATVYSGKQQQKSEVCKEITERISQPSIFRRVLDQHSKFQLSKSLCVVKQR